MGNNIKDLDALHQVMRGDITLDKACEGMTDDFEIGHVSHRKDGDYRKVAQGKWVPVKAGGAQMGAGEKATEQKMTNTLKDIFTAGKTDEYFSESNEDGAKRMLREDYGLSESETNRIYEQLRIMHNAKIDEENGQKADADAGRERRYNNERYGVNEKPEQKDNPYQHDQDDFMSRLSIYSNKIKDPSKVSVKRTPQGNWQAYYDGGFLGTFSGDTLDPEAAMELGWWERPAPDFADDAAPRLTRDTKIRLSQVKREQTQDERRTYKIGEISEKTGLQKTANGWREVKKGGAGLNGARRTAWSQEKGPWNEY